MLALEVLLLLYRPHNTNKYLAYEMKPVFHYLNYGFGSQLINLSRFSVIVMLFYFFKGESWLKLLVNLIFQKSLMFVVII